MSKGYLRAFKAQVYARLGGLDMADEFFRLHPELVTPMKLSSLYHQVKGGAAWKGAAIFYRQQLLPVLRADRAEACRTPIE